MSVATTPPRVGDRQRVGYWLGRAVEGGPLVPIAVAFRAVKHEPGRPDNDMRGTRSPTLVGVVGGVEVHPEEAWRCLPLRFDGGRWVRGAGEITEAEYRFRVADLDWLQAHQPHDPASNPFEAVDPMMIPPQF